MNVQTWKTYNFYICTSWFDFHLGQIHGMTCSRTKPWEIYWWFKRSSTFLQVMNDACLYSDIQHKKWWTIQTRPILYLLTSSADWAMKNPTMLAAILFCLGLMEILVSPPSPCLASIERRRSFSLTKHNLQQGQLNSSFQI